MRLHRLIVFCSTLLTTGCLVAAEREATPPSLISAPEDFQVQLLRSAQEDEGSWISLTFDPHGRIIVGMDDYGLGRLTIDGDNSAAEFERLAGTEMFRHARGVLYANDSLYVCATDSKAVYRLRDTTGDGQYDEVVLMKEMDYRSRYGHGTNQMVPAPNCPPWGPDGRSSQQTAEEKLSDRVLYLVNGNDVSFPEGCDPDSPYRSPRNDWLLPSPHDAGHDDRVGHIIRVDPEGKQWTIMAGGFRNQFDIAFNLDGEMFTWDADMEWDVGLPWYRPTRLNHVVSGGEYGWRWGTGKWPAWYPDSLPTTLDTALGSPTGMIFGTTSSWPERYRRALFMADWQHGRILLVDLIPQGASYTAKSELFIEGGPLNVCDLSFGPDGNLYFITGGRGSQSGLYRVTFTGSHDVPHDRSLEIAGEATEDESLHRAARQLRHRLEQFHTRQDAAAVDFIWEYLGSPDVWLRFAARVALENQPLETWRPRVAQAADSLARRTALLALARVGQPEDQTIILSGLTHIDWPSLSAEELLLPLRTMQLTFIRQGQPDELARRQCLEKIDALFPHESFQVNWLLAELLAYLEAPLAAERMLELLLQAPTQEEQIQYAKTLVRVTDRWNETIKQQMLEWLVRSRRLPGGRLLATTMETIRSDALQSLTDEERQAFSVELAKLDEPLVDKWDTGLENRPLVQRWIMADLLDDVLDIHPEEHSVDAGQTAMAAAICLRCHQVGQRGGMIGPDLTNVGKRMDGRALLESILEPSKQIDPKYQYLQYLLEDGQLVTGRPTSVTSSHLTIEVDPLSGRSISIAREQIEHSQASPISPMPDGLLDTLTRQEILDLIAYLLR